MAKNGKREKGIWYVLEAAGYNQSLVGLSREEIADWAISLGRALAKQERGLNEFADELMAERDRYLADRRRTGSMGGLAKAKNGMKKAEKGDVRSPKVTPRSPKVTPRQYRTVPYRKEEVTKKQLDTKPEEKEVSKVRARVGGKSGRVRVKKTYFSGTAGDLDKYELLASIPDGELPAAACEYCGDGDVSLSIGGFTKRLRELGAPRFREVFARFVGECEANEEPEVRGAALQAALKAARRGRK